MMRKEDRVSLNGVLVYPFTSKEELLEYIDANKGILVAVNAEKILHATDQTRGIINRNIGYCDGSGAVLALRKKGFDKVIKIAGCELWQHIVKRYNKEKSFYLVGSKPDVIKETVEKLRHEFPKINIVGYRDGYIKNDKERRILIEDIASKKPDVVFIAMGSPKQELLMEEMQKRHNAIYQGLGGSFDVYTEYVERAPQWWCRHNMEFAYRLLKEPKRIKRQIHLLKFAYWLVFNKL
jgi:UDP-N-acetyl-D-mannosaminouronate:lipid I N-acetyl-D-mannosaminouronosyltransferase